jgi:hypothetical protein
MAPGPSSRARHDLMMPEALPFAFPGVTLKVVPSMKILSLSAMVPGAICD